MFSLHHRLCKVDYKVTRQVIRALKVAGKFPWETDTLMLRKQKISLAKGPKQVKTNIGFARKKPSEVKFIAVDNNSQENSEICLHSFNDAIDYNFKLDQINDAAYHYNIFAHLFGSGYFDSVIDLHVSFDVDANFYPVYFGNVIVPSVANTRPQIEIGGPKESLYTLTLSCPDQNVPGDGTEHLHWLVANIKGDDLTQAETVCPYLQPFPAFGTGFHRYVCVLYKQDRNLDIGRYFQAEIGMNRESRVFSSEQFYRHFEDDITPVSLKFFQSEWDPSVRKVFHDIFDEKEPEYEYDWPEDHRDKQEKWPKGRAFNVYLDLYRDRKEIKEQVLKDYFKSQSPFSPQRRDSLPNIGQIYDKTTWEKMEEQEKRLRRRKYQYWPGS